jgi:hypothetical protein
MSNQARTHGLTTPQRQRGRANQQQGQPRRDSPEARPHVGGCGAFSLIHLEEETFTFSTTRATDSVRFMPKRR